jgi:hypothetical protein
MQIRSWPLNLAAADGTKLAEITPGDIDTFFFTNGDAECDENAIKIARLLPTQNHRSLSRQQRRYGKQHCAYWRSAPLGCRADQPEHRPLFLQGKASVTRTW